MAENGYVPVFYAANEGQMVVAELETDDGQEFSVMSAARADELVTEIMALADKLSIEGLTAVGKALEWIADDLLAVPFSLEKNTDG